MEEFLFSDGRDLSRLETLVEEGLKDGRLQIKHNLGSRRLSLS